MPPLPILQFKNTVAPTRCFMNSTLYLQLVQQDFQQVPDVLPMTLPTLQQIADLVAKKFHHSARAHEPLDLIV